MKKIFPNRVYQFLAVLLAAVTLCSPLIFVKEYYFKQLSPDLTSTIFFIITITVVITMVNLINKRRKTKMSYEFKLTHQTLIPLIIICLIGFQIGLNLPLGKFLGTKFGNAGNHTPVTPSIALILGAVLVAPFFEEILFRGILLKGLLTSYSSRNAIIISSVIFAVIHINPSQITAGLFIGLFSGWIYVKTKSLGITMIIHFVSNLSSLTIGYLINKSGNYVYASSFKVYGTFTFLIMTISLAVMAGAFYSLNQKMKDITDSSKEEGAITAPSPI